MQLNRELLNQLVPQGTPPESLITTRDVDEAGRFAESPLLSRSYLWAQAISRAALDSDMRVPPRLSHFSVGFVPLPPLMPTIEGWSSASATVGGFAFGGYVLARSALEPVVQRLVIGDLSFPLVIAPGEIELHGCPPYPTNGSAACWVKNVSGVNSWTTGILSCRHLVAGMALGTSVSLIPSRSHSNPVSAKLAEIDESTIDASVLEIDPADWPAGVSSLNATAPAPPGQAVELDGRFTTKKSGTVLRVFHNPGYVGNLFGQRLITDCYGINGDSGSLLSESATRAGLGIYMGTIPDGHGGREGIFQDLSQVQSYFGLNLYL